MPAVGADPDRKSNASPDAPHDPVRRMPRAGRGMRVDGGRDARVGVSRAYGFGDRQQVYITARAGSVCGGWRRLVVPYDGWAAYPLNPAPLPTGTRLGFVWGWYDGSVVAGVPFWFLACVAAAAGGWSLRKRRTPPDADRCLSCGYDLRATPERCPECGAVPRRRSGAAA